MIQKIKITEYVIKELDLNPIDLKKYLRLWWRNTRLKSNGGLWLTESGLAALNKAQLKNYQIQLDEPIKDFENNFIIWLDNNIKYPFYLTKKEIFVFDEKTAIQIILFSGNLKMWQKAHIKSKEKIVDKT